MRGYLVVDTGIPTQGKALDINTEIATPNGFRKLGDLRVGDIVFDEKGEQCKVTWKSEVFESRPTYELTFSDNSTIIADENHEWLTDDWKSRRSESNSVRNNRNTPRELKRHGSDQSWKRATPTIKTTKEIVGSIKTKNDNRNNHSINNCLPVQTKEVDCIIDPYVLGCWLGDGTSSDGGFSSSDLEIIANISDRGFTVAKRQNKYGYGIIGIRTKLRELNLLNNKHIPKKYLFGNIDQRFELLRGLMDTDGHCSIVEARKEYCGINKRLCEDVYSLICSLGIKATFVEGDAVLYGKVISKKYRIFFKTDNKIFNLKRKQDVIDNYFRNGRGVRGNNCRYIVSAKLVQGHKTQCIEVNSESHLFLAGKQFIPTHNSNWTE